LPAPAPGTSHGLRWSVAIIAGIIAVLAATTDIALSDGEHMRELGGHLKQGLSAASAALCADFRIQSCGEGAALAPRTASARPKIVLDPGHGGNESGAVGHGGLKEKDLTLQICSILRDRLASRLGAQVIFTRTGDLSVPLEERVAIANQSGADLLISIHANSSEDAGVHGVETYYAVSPAAENRALPPAADGSNLSESRKLAVEIQRALESVGGERSAPNRGVKQAPFVVLLNARIPSVLAEVGFITNPAEGHDLGTTAGQEAVADALYRGIADYLAAAGRGKAVTDNGQ